MPSRLYAASSSSIQKDWRRNDIRHLPLSSLRNVVADFMVDHHGLVLTSLLIFLGS
jgi:hypothetical protein